MWIGVIILLLIPYVSINLFSSIHSSLSPTLIEVNTTSIVYRIRNTTTSAYLFWGHTKQNEERDVHFPQPSIIPSSSESNQERIQNDSTLTGNSFVPTSKPTITRTQLPSVLNLKSTERPTDFPVQNHPVENSTERPTNFPVQNHPIENITERPTDSHIHPIGNTTQTPTNSPVHQSQQKSNSPESIRFFPWGDDSLNYNNVCKDFYSVFGKFKGPVIVNSGYGGGLGHIASSFYYSITYALLLQRPFYCTCTMNYSFVVDLKPAFWKHTNSCFQRLQYDESMRYFLFNQ